MKVEQFQEVNRIEQVMPDNVDRMATIICYLYKKKPERVNLWSARKFMRYTKKVTSNVTRRSFFSRVKMFSDASDIQFGQFLELQHWLKNDPIEVMDLIGASILKKRGNHSEDAAMIRSMHLSAVYPKVALFIESWNNLIRSYSGLFEIDENVEGEEVEQQPTGEGFMDRFGWIFSAAALAEHERITLNDTYELPVIQALNGLAYLKAKAQFEKEKLK